MLDLTSLATLSPEMVAAARTGLRILHFLGLVLGLGAATLLDLLLLRFLVAGQVSRDHCDTVEFAARIVAAGLALLWISGLGFLALYALSEPAALGNGKLWAKIAIVGILTLNGAFIHEVALPLIRRNAGRGLLDGVPEDRRLRLLASGVVSATSWYVPLLLASNPQLDFTVQAWLILAAYAALLLLGLVFASGLACWLPQEDAQGADTARAPREAQRAPPPLARETAGPG